MDAMRAEGIVAELSGAFAGVPNLVLLHLAVERRSVQSENLRRFLLVPVGALERLENRFVMLILVLKNHVVHESAGEQRVVRVELLSVEPLENALANLSHPARHFF